MGVNKFEKLAGQIKEVGAGLLEGDKCNLIVALDEKGNFRALPVGGPCGKNLKTMSPVKKKFWERHLEKLRKKGSS